MVNDLLFDGLFDLKILLELSRESFHLQVEMALFLLLFIPSEARPFDDDVESTHSRQSDGHCPGQLERCETNAPNSFGFLESLEYSLACQFADIQEAAY